MTNNDRELISTDVQFTTNLSRNDLTSINGHLSTTFYSKDSALGLSDEHIHQNVNNDLIKPNETIDETMNQLDDLPLNQRIKRTISSSSSEQLIPKEKQTGMYYKAFGSSAALHLAEEYNSEWLQASSTNESEENHLRIVHQCDNLGADISEPFADRLISTSVQSDFESIPSLEPEQILNENLPIEPIHVPSPSPALSPSPSPPPLPFPSSSTVVKEPLEYVFNYPSQMTSTDDLFDLETDDKPLSISVTFDTDDLPPPMIPIKDTYTELSLFRPHSLSTIPSSRASQYASSVDSDDQFEHEHHFTKENSDDDRGVIGSEFSSPQSRPLSSITSQPLSPEPNQTSSSSKFADIDHDAWERAINDECTQNLSSIIPIDNLEEKHTYLIDEILPVVITDKNHDKTYIEEISIQPNLSSFQQDYLTHELSAESFVDPKELSQRLEQLDHSIKQEEKIIIHQPILTKSFQRLEKVSDLEIVKSDRGFKIGYTDRQGTDQRIILTKRIEAGPDVLERDPHSRLPSKGRRILNPTYSSVLYTNGYNKLEEDTKFEHTADEIEVLSIGTNPKHFDESDMVSIDIDGPSTMLSSICESIVITQGSVYSKPLPKPNEEDPLLHVQTTHSIKNDKIEVIDSWHDRTVIHGNGTPWRSPFKPPKSSTKQEKSTRDIALSPIPLSNEFDSQTVDRSCQYSPPTQQDQSLQCYFESLTTYDHPGYYKLSTDNPPLRTLMSLERSADSGILVDENHRTKSHLALQVDLKSSSSDSEDLSEMNTTRPLNIYEPSPNLNGELEQEIVQLRRERAHILDLLSLNWNRSNIWVELTEAKLNYIIGETDALLRSLSFDPTPVDNETIKLKMHQYEEDMADLTRQHLAVYRERLEDSKKQLDLKIIELESRKSLMEIQPVHSTSQQHSRLLPNKRTKSFLSTSAENLTRSPLDESMDTHQHLLDISFLTTKTSDSTVHRPIPRYTSKNLSKMEGLSQSQQAIIDETDKLIQDSQQLHTESASQFERARESLLSSETSIRLARANLAASRHSEKKPYLPKDVTLAELFKYEQSLAKETAKSYRHIYSTTEF